MLVPSNFWFTIICTPPIGLGSRFVEKVRTEYPRSTILSVAIAPHSHGELPLQHYNSLLALSHLQQFADGVVLFQNDSVLEDVMKTSQKSAPGKSSSCSLDDMNASSLSFLVGIVYTSYIYRD